MFNYWKKTLVRLFLSKPPQRYFFTSIACREENDSQKWFSVAGDVTEYQEQLPTSNGRAVAELWTGRQVQARTQPQPENISPNPVRTWKAIWNQNQVRKKTENLVRSKNVYGYYS